MKVKVTFTEPTLGTKPGVREILKKYVAGKNPAGISEDELPDATDEDIAEEVKHMSTFFHKDADGNPCVFDYQIKGFFKDACGMLRRADGMLSTKLKAYKKEIDGLIFPKPRLIKINLPNGAQTEFIERPLRAPGPKGERVCLVRSEACPPGSTMEFGVLILRKALVPYIHEWLEYGQLHGFSQWRSSGMGRFEYTSTGGEKK